MTLDAVLQIYLALLGLAAGSFLNVVIYRLPRRVSTVLPRSRCTRCRSAIRPWDNVPVLSYLLLGGRCRHCGAAISWRYPFIEALTACLFVACYRTFQESLDAALAACVFCALMIVLGMIDFEHYILPDAVTLPGTAFGLLVLPWLDWPWADPWWNLWLGAAAGAGVLAAVAWGWYAWKRVHGMGMGDVKMLAMIGAVLGWQGVGSTLFLASLAGSLVGGAALVSGRMGLRSRLPFGVFLALGGVVTLFFHQQIFDLYGDFTVAVGAWLYGP